MQGYPASCALHRSTAYQSVTTIYSSNQSVCPTPGIQQITKVPRAHTGRKGRRPYSTNMRCQRRSGRTTRRPGNWRSYYSTNSRPSGSQKPNKLLDYNGSNPQSSVTDRCVANPSRYARQARAHCSMSWPRTSSCYAVISLLPHQSGVVVGYRAVEGVGFKTDNRDFL